MGKWGGDKLRRNFPEVLASRGQVGQTRRTWASFKAAPSRPVALSDSPSIACRITTPSTGPSAERP